ncbi:MAG: tRNA preQ1(34) S-adenosylmethionine ribosyltransferase-isomerase QueA, partial [Hyphomicrobiales bacterium]|nr:tRNA preQ1(34) S-adenosylmethionine ribosyltransferase-isomerase QueA [Hyphomicrobiales bacterium]
MRVDLFDFELPDELIALRPAFPRNAARLLVIDPNAAVELRDRQVADLPDQLRAGDVVVLNDTRVIPARLFGVRVRGEASARVEILLHKRLAADRWRAFARPAKRLATGDRIVFGDVAEGVVCELQHLMATVETKPHEGEVDLAFDFHGPILDEAIERFGHMPLPPYIAQRRDDDDQDRADYQTAYAREPGAVAAPTAGLHLDVELLDRIRARDVAIATVTLHVGPGTFLPVKAQDTNAHRMHPEWGRIDAPTAQMINAARQKGGRIIAIGTTTLRLLESAASPDGTVLPFSDETAIFITPGFRCKVADALMTNFHLPRSTLFMLVSAFAGLETMRR